MNPALAHLVRAHTDRLTNRYFNSDAKVKAPIGLAKLRDRFLIVIITPTKSYRDRHVRLGSMKWQIPFVQRGFLQGPQESIR
jgi:hypothetical protein